MMTEEEYRELMAEGGEEFTCAELFMLALAEDDACPMCLGDLDEGWECHRCGYDARPLIIGDMPQ